MTWFGTSLLVLFACELLTVTSSEADNALKPSDELWVRFLSPENDYVVYQDENTVIG